MLFVFLLPLIPVNKNYQKTRPKQCTQQDYVRPSRRYVPLCRHELSSLYREKWCCEWEWMSFSAWWCVRQAYCSSSREYCMLNIDANYRWTLSAQAWKHAHITMRHQLMLHSRRLP